MAETQLIVSLSPMPPDYNENFSEWEKNFISRLVIKSPYGPVQQQIGGIEPTSNVGIWWKDGDKPYIWDETEKKYIPANLEDSITTPFWYGSTTPITQDPKLWLETYDTDLSARWKHWNGTAWTLLPVISNSGTTANRPLNPSDYEQYFDTDIKCLIHWERAAWRTVSGTPGDIKMVDTSDVDYATAVTNALLRNPGWTELASAQRGRALAIAGSGPGLSARSPLDTAGVEEVALTEDELPVHKHGLSLDVATYDGLNNRQSGGSQPGIGTLPPDTLDETQSVGLGHAHENMPPTIWFVALRKD